MNEPQEIEILPADQAAALPAIIGTSSARAVAALEDWFYGEVANDNTRAAYKRALLRFSTWARDRGYTVAQLRAPQLRAYLKEMETSGLSPSTIKQHLAAIREAFNALMRAGEIEVNPAYSVKGPRLSVTGGKTPAFDAENARKFLESIDASTIKGKRDRALICLMMYSFARITAALGMNGDDYFQHNDGHHLRIKEKGGKLRILPAHSALVAAMADYLEATGLRGKPLPLWQTIDRKTGQLSGRRLSRTDAYQMLTDRAKEAGFTEAKYGNHTWRATGITAFLESGGAVDLAQKIAGHADPRTTGLYDRRQDRINQNEIERIRI